MYKHVSDISLVGTPTQRGERHEGKRDHITIVAFSFFHKVIFEFQRCSSHKYFIRLQVPLGREYVFSSYNILVAKAFTEEMIHDKGITDKSATCCDND